MITKPNGLPIVEGGDHVIMSYIDFIAVRALLRRIKNSEYLDSSGNIQKDGSIFRPYKYEAEVLLNKWDIS